MRSVWRRAASVASCMLVGLVATACGGSGSGLSGSISGDGSSTVLPITEAVAEEFQKENGGVQISVRASGTGGGFEKFCKGETDIQDASRPIKDEGAEKPACEKNEIEYVELTVALDGLAVVVHPETRWVDCLTVAELKKIWEPAAEGKIMNWSQVRAGFPNKALKLFGPGTDSGTFDYFTEEIVGETGDSRSDYEGNENDDVLVQGVSGTEGALGYFGYSYYAQNKNKLKVLGVDSGEGCVAPSDDTVRANTYTPLSRPLFLYVKKAAVAKEEVRAFVEFYLDAVSSLLAEVGYTPVADTVLQQEKTEFSAFAGG